MNALTRGAAALLLLTWPVLSARNREVTVPWSALGNEVTGQAVTVRGPDKKRWKGRVESVGGSGLVLTSAKGSETVPRQSIREIEFRRTLGTRGRAIGAAAGAGAGIPVVAFSEIYQNNETSNARLRGAAIGIAAGAVAIGYFLGRERDVERVVVRVSGD